MDNTHQTFPFIFCVPAMIIFLHGNWVEQLVPCPSLRFLHLRWSVEKPKRRLEPRILAAPKPEVNGNNDNYGGGCVLCPPSRELRKTPRLYHHLCKLSTPGSSWQGPRRHQEGRTRSFRLGSSRADEKQSRMSEVPCQAVSIRAGSKRQGAGSWGEGGGLLKAVGVGWTSCHITGGGSQATLTAASASTGWTICSTWPMESKGNSAPVPLSLPTAPLP